jgi:hypothetical protein
MTTTSDMTIDAAAAAGFTHIEARCRCGQITALPFRLLISEGRTRPDSTLGSIAARLRCHQCTSTPTTWRPWFQYIDGAPGYAYGDYSRPRDGS